jgi:hypothetical protein
LVARLSAVRDHSSSDPPQAEFVVTKAILFLIAIGHTSTIDKNIFSVTNAVGFAVEALRRCRGQANLLSNT